MNLFFAGMEGMTMLVINHQELTEIEMRHGIHGGFWRGRSMGLVVCVCSSTP